MVIIKKNKMKIVSGGGILNGFNRKQYGGA